MTNRSQLTAIILAGGKSSRMGEDKALISILGMSGSLLQGMLPNGLADPFQLSRIQSAKPPPRPRAAIKSGVTKKNAKKGRVVIG
jgi:hypothetical protein